MYVSLAVTEPVTLADADAVALADAVKLEETLDDANTLGVNDELVLEDTVGDGVAAALFVVDGVTDTVVDPVEDALAVTETATLQEAKHTLGTKLLLLKKSLHAAGRFVLMRKIWLRAGLLSKNAHGKIEIAVPARLMWMSLGSAARSPCGSTVMAVMELRPRKVRSVRSAKTPASRLPSPP